MKKEKLASTLEQIDEILAATKKLTQSYKAELAQVIPKNKISAQNLIYYRAMRQTDMREIQKLLGQMGLSRMAKAEGHVLFSLRTTKAIIESLVNETPLILPKVSPNPKKSQKHLSTNAKKLLGYRSNDRRTRIMVTMPSEAANNAEMVNELVAAGMNSARINCAHDNAESWAKMIQHIREAQGKHRRKIKVCMDLAGPKIRTGDIKEGPQIVRIKAKKDEFGQTISPANIWLSPEPAESSAGIHLPISSEALAHLQKGMKLQFRDIRNKKRRFIITQKQANGVWAISNKTAYISSGTPLYIKQDQAPMILGDLNPLESALSLKNGDELVVHKVGLSGENALYDEEGKLLHPAHISCTSQEVFQYVNEGERILFDDGKIEGVIRSCSADEMKVEIIRARSGGAKLRADKGINFPDSDLRIHGLTAKDKEDLKFVAEHADVVNMSFVNRKEDVMELLEELEKLGQKDRIGIILKIETRRGFQNLTDILLAAMQTEPIGVMIARGDLAIECGWEQIGRIQEEILWLCQAAHIPDVWATQVLENLAKTGLPSRAEITDATMSQRAECVMLNKGPYIVDAIILLDAILKNMQQYQEKKAPMLPVLEG